MENSQSIDLILDPANQSEITDKNERSRMSKLCKNGKYLCENEDGEVKTLYDAFKTGARVSNNGKAYGWKPSPSEPFQWISYNDVLVRAANVGAGLIAKGLKPENTTNVGIYSQNRVEYGITEQACYMYSMVLVPLYDTLGPEACTHIINQAEIKTVVCDKNVKVKAILSRIKETPDLESIILVEEPSEEMKELAQKHNIDLTSFAELEALGEKNPQEPKPAKPDDLCVLCYTSGTTGLPKGAMLTHRGTMATVVAAGTVLKPGGIDISPEDTLISYLPLAHSYERLLECYCVLNGARIGFLQGDVKLLLDDIKELQPTLFPSVPRLLNRIYDKKEDKKKKKTEEAILNADTSEVKMIFGKQKVHIRNRRSCHGTKLLKSSLCLALIFWPSAGGTGHGSGQTEHQGHSDIYPSTLNVVSNCPSLGEYMQRSLAKCADVCGSYLQDGNCVYHCMRDSSKTKLVEFCAKPKPLFDFCPEYDPVDQTIQKDTATLCNSTFSQNYYNSSDIYFCDPNNCLQLRESSVRSGATTLTTLMNETTEMNDGDSQELFVWLFVGLAALTLAIIIGYIFHCVFVRLGIFSEQSRKMTEKGNQNGQQHVYTEEMITLV